jgi:hypothetical protein
MSMESPFTKGGFMRVPFLAENYPVMKGERSKVRAALSNYGCIFR